MATYLLVHGAWHGAWCWEKIIPLLKKEGHQVIAPDLPGHGEDKTPLKEITLQSYVKTLSDILDRLPEPVILVGHSLGGIIISQVAEYRPKKISKLVFLAAFIPHHGESMFMVAQKQAPGRFSKLMRHDPLENAFYFPAKFMKAFAYHQCSDALMTQIAPLFCVEPLAPAATAVELTEENFGKIPRIYIECAADRAILLSTQQLIQQAVPCQKVYRLNCDHSPFYSDPAGLHEILLSLQ